MADVQHFYSLLPFQDPIDYTIDVGFVAEQQMPELFFFRHHRTPVRMFLEAQYRFLETLVPIERGIGIPGINALIDLGEVALCAGSDANEVCPVWLQTRQKTPLPAASFPCWRPPILAGSPPQRPRERQGQAIVDRRQRPALRLPPALLW